MSVLLIFLVVFLLIYSVFMSITCKLQSDDIKDLRLELEKYKGLYRESYEKLKRSKDLRKNHVKNVGDFECALILLLNELAKSQGNVCINELHAKYDASTYDKYHIDIKF